MERVCSLFFLRERTVESGFGIRELDPVMLGANYAYGRKGTLIGAIRSRGVTWCCDLSFLVTERYESKGYFLDLQGTYCFHSWYWSKRTLDVNL